MKTLQLRMATKRDASGALMHISIWQGLGPSNRWQSRVTSLETKLPELLGWLNGRVADPGGWLAQRLPDIGPIMSRVMFGRERGGHRWVYVGKIGVVRAENGRFTCAMDIHGGTRHLRGSWPGPAAAEVFLRANGAERVVFLAPGENAGDNSRGKPDGWRSEKFQEIAP